LIAAEELYKYCKKEKEQQQKVADFDSHEIQGNSQSPATDFVETNDSSSEQEGESDKSSEKESSESYGGTAQGEETQVKSSGEKDEPEVRTAESLEDKIRDLVGNDQYENTYIEVPQVNLDTAIGKNSEVHKDIDNSFFHQQKFIMIMLKKKWVILQQIFTKNLILILKSSNLLHRRKLTIW
jgi:hypothetical protein